MQQGDPHSQGPGYDGTDHAGFDGGPAAPENDPFLRHEGGRENVPLGDLTDEGYGTQSNGLEMEQMAYAKNGKQKKRRPELVVVLMMLPWLLFTLVECLFAFALVEFGALVWTLVALCALLSGLFVAIGVLGRKPQQLSLGLLCIAAIAVGAAVGMLVVDEYMEEFNRLDKGATYTNLDPANAALSHADAATLEFEAGSFIDGFRTVGRMQEGEVYCVAPVSGPSYTPEVQYWATGTNCCGERRDFSCGDADARPASGDLPDVRSAIVLDSEDAKDFKEAARMASSLYGLQATDGAVFVRWVKNPREFREGLWTNATTVVLMASALHLISSVLAALLVNRALSSKDGQGAPA